MTRRRGLLHRGGCSREMEALIYPSPLTFFYRDRWTRRHGIDLSCVYDIVLIVPDAEFQCRRRDNGLPLFLR
jgi:hypothetical protein